MSTPNTPSKSEEVIAEIKQSLSAKWGLQFPPRDVVASPSTRDKTTVYEKVHRFMAFLHFQNPTALDSAIALFEEQALEIISEWQFKPKAESGVIPRRAEVNSTIAHDFLHRRRELGSEASGALVLRLEHILYEMVQITKTDRPFQKQPSMMSADKAKESMSAKTSSQAWFLDDSQLNFAESFQDRDIDLVLRNHPIHDERSKSRSHYSKTSWAPSIETPSTGIASNANEIFVTPPTTPSPKKRVDQSSEVRDYSPSKRPRLPLNKEWFGRNGASSNINEAQKLSSSESNLVSVPPSSCMSHRISQIQESSIYDSQTDSCVPSISSSMTSTLSSWASPNTSFGVISQCSSFELIPQQLKSKSHTTRLPRAAVWPNSPNSSASGHQSYNPHFQSHGVGHSYNRMDIDHEAVSTAGSESNSVATISQEQKVNPILDFSTKLQSASPFTSSELVKQARVPFRQIYEVERIARAANIDITAFSECLTNIENHYPTLLNTLGEILKARNLQLPERSSTNAWEKAQGEFSGISLMAKFRFHETIHDGYFDLKLMPLKTGPTYRLSRHFGGDRFCVVLIPGLDAKDLPPYLKADAETFRAAFVDWLVGTRHQLLGRYWRAFFVKPERSKKLSNRNSNPNYGEFRLYLFAEDGVGFSSIERPVGEVGWRGKQEPDRQPVRIQQLIEWFMPFKQNGDQYALKFFARLSLGLSTTTKTVTFEPWQIKRSDDAVADSPCERRLDTRLSDLKKTGRSQSRNSREVMNDGCSRLSKPRASQVAMQLNLDYTPSVFQARIGGAKGVWMVNALEEAPNRGDIRDALWIEITDSQLKFEAPPIDSIYPEPDRVTFEVNTFSKPLSSSYLNYQLLRILHDRGVPRDVFRKLLADDLQRVSTEFEGAMKNGLELRKWCQSHCSTTTERLKSGGIQMLGGLPDSKSEKIHWFIDHGFEPNSCLFLKDLVFQNFRDYCFRLEERMNIALESSTSAIMIADPLDVLEEGEIHILFSRSFKDHGGFDVAMLHGMEVLVARSPALLPSDVQKVRAVFKPELRIYRDVIVFPSRGERSLASKLSGGDYDGDTAWICWEPSIVEPFKNALVPEKKPPEFFGIEKDSVKVSDLIQYPDYVDRFLKHGFKFTLQPSLLGIVNTYHESLCYARNSIDSPDAILIALLQGHLVDSSKTGFNFPNSKWEEFCAKRFLPKQFPKPAYKDKSTSRPKDNLIDELVFDIIRKTGEDVLANFHQQFKDTPTWDEDLIGPCKKETLEAQTDPSIALALKGFKEAFEQITTYWKRNFSRNDVAEGGFSKRLADKGNASSFKFREIVTKCRKDFLAIPPCNDEYSYATASPVVRRWAGGSRDWDLLKASVAYENHHKFFKCIWHIAGVELGELKATAKGRGTYHTIINSVYASLKLDKSLADAEIRRRRTIDEEKNVFVEQTEVWDDDVDFDDYFDAFAGQEFDDDENQVEEDFGEWPWDDDDI